MVPDLIPVTHRITLHTALKLRHDSEHGLICWSGNCETKQHKQEIVQNYQIYGEAVHADQDRKRCEIAMNDFYLTVGMNQRVMSQEKQQCLWL